jgi:hypothetical protein
MKAAWNVLLASAALGVLPTLTPALGQAPPGYGLNFLTIGAPGNRATLPFETPLNPEMNVGAVGYEYRIMRSNLSNAQYVDFLYAYAPYWRGDVNDVMFTGLWTGGQQLPGGQYKFTIAPGAEHYSTKISFEMAARYCNWLHNGKSNEHWAFNTGAYEIGDEGFSKKTWAKQMVHSPGAKYWIPSLDEYDKAAYYDPDRYGPGKEGYWLYPDGGDDPLVRGLPSEPGSQTIGDLLAGVPGWFPGGWDLEQYPDTKSPWGLIDVSATNDAWTTGIALDSYLATGGSSAHSNPVYQWEDRLDSDGGGSLFMSLNGLRIVSAVPGPSGVLVFLTTVALTQRRKR